MGTDPIHLGTGYLFFFAPTQTKTQTKTEIKHGVVSHPDSWLCWLFSRFLLLLCCLALRIVRLGRKQRRECRRGVGVLGGKTFPYQQQNHQPQTTRCWFAEEQGVWKTAESFLTSSCSSSGTWSPWGCVCQREEGSWWPLIKGWREGGGQLSGLKALNHKTIYHSPKQGERPTSPQSQPACCPPSIPPTRRKSSSFRH